MEICSKSQGILIFTEFLTAKVAVQQIAMKYRVGHQNLLPITNVQITITPKSKELKSKIR